MPDNAVFYHIAYAMAAGIYALYSLSLYLRRKRARARHSATEA